MSEHTISIARIVNEVGPASDPIVAATVTCGDDTYTLHGNATPGQPIILDRGHPFMRGWVSADRTQWQLHCMASDVRILGRCESRGGVLVGRETSYSAGRWGLPGEKSV